MAAIVVEQVTRQFPGEAHPAVRQVSFEASAGELVVLLGPSGCGKTTLLKLINRLYEPTSGRILVHGVDIRSVPGTVLRRGIGYVIQQTGLFPHLRVERNIATVPELLGWPPARITARVDELLELVGLPASYRRRYPRQLSGGEQQRVGLARALAADPPILLMDEPFGALDAINRSRLQEELLRIQRRLHKTVLFVTHDVEEALILADRVLVMRAGALVQYAPPLELLTSPADGFVAELLGRERMLRQLSLQPVAAAMQPGRAPHAAPAISSAADLRTALSALLASPEGVIAVRDAQGEPVGVLRFDDIRRVVAATREPARAAD